MRLEWGLGARPYDQGLDRGVLYLSEGALPWNGLVSVDEDATAAMDTVYYFDGNKMHVAVERFDYKASLKAYTYPDAFAEYNGYSDHDQYQRFGLSYRTEHGDGYQLHLVYNALVVPGTRSWSTLTESTDPSLFEWDISATSIPVLGAQPTAHLIIDSRSMGFVVRYIEEILYGTSTTAPRLPEAYELIDLYEDAMTLRVTYNQDGTYTVEGADELVQVLPDGTFRINAPSAFQLEDGKFIVSSYSDD